MFTLNNPNGLVFVRGQPDHKEFAAGHAYTRFEPDDQIGQIFGRQLEGRSIRREQASNRVWKGCAGMRQACERSGVARRGAGRSRHSSPRCSIGARLRASHPTALAWTVGRRVRDAACAAVYMQMWAASATEGAALFKRAFPSY